MLKVGDWIEPTDPKIYHNSEALRYQKVKEIEAKDGDLYVLNFYSRWSAWLEEGQFRILTPEEVKAKGLDEKSYLVTQEPNDGVKTASQEEVHETKKPYTKFLFVEDGSITIDTVTGIEERNPEIKVILYAKGAQMPVLVDIKENK